MTQVTIDRIYRDLKETKFGEKEQISLKVREVEVIDINGKAITVGSRYIRGFFKPNDTRTTAWSEGSTIDISVVEKGEYLNFTMPKEGQPDTGGLVARIARIEEHLGLTRKVEEDNQPDPDEF